MQKSNNYTIYSQFAYKIHTIHSTILIDPG